MWAISTSMLHLWFTHFSVNSSTIIMGMILGFMGEQSTKTVVTVILLFLQPLNLLLQYVTLRAVTSTPTLHTCNTASSYKVYELCKGV